MKERPILFSGEMVRAILAGLKSQTRRTAGLDYINQDPDAWRLVMHGPLLGRHAATFEHVQTAERFTAFCPYGQAGDRLWGREAWHLWGPPEHQVLAYRADYSDPESYTWKPSIHMPRTHARLLFDLQAVRIARVQSICEADAWAEGVKPDVSVIIPHNAARKAFARLWDAINGKRGMGWGKNPWVWPLTIHQVSE